MKSIKLKLEEKSDEDLLKLAKVKKVKGYKDMDREELIKKLVEKYEKTVCTTC